MEIIKIYNVNNKPNETEKEEIINFLFKHLEQYGDKKVDISKCLDYAVKDQISAQGGFVLELKNEEGLQGITIINETGMGGYIPENILVYIAVNNESRGKGYGKTLMKKALELAEGDVALHVEPDNPAKFLYEKVGFSSKYIEMRYKK